MGFLAIATVFAGLWFLRWVHSVSQKLYRNAHDVADGDVVRYFRGDFLDIKKCTIDWNWIEPSEVGNIFSFIVKFFSNNGLPYNIFDDDRVTVAITTGISSRLNIPHVVSFADAEQCEENKIRNEMKVSFTVTKSGAYNISINHHNFPIKGSPFLKTFIPGRLSPEHSILARTAHASLSVVTMTVEQNRRLTIDARDEYENKCFSRLNQQDFDKKFNVAIHEASDSQLDPPFTWSIKPDMRQQLLVLDILIYSPGCFKALLSYDGTEIMNGSFDMIVLNALESDEVQSNLDKRNLNTWFECRLFEEPNYEGGDDATMGASAVSQRNRIQSMGDAFTFPSLKIAGARSKSLASNTKKLRKVYCYITPKQLVIKEYFLKIFPKRLFTFKVCPATKMLCDDVNETSDHSTFVIDDGFQPRVMLSCDRRNVLAATFVGILHSNMGRSDSFEGKVSHFNKQLREHHDLDKGRRREVKLNINRNDLLHSSFQATKGFSTSDWCQRFIVHFKGENGIDWGGLNREWNHLVCKALFDPKSENEDGTTGGCGMFRRTKDDPQALVLPNTTIASGLKLKYYEFAGKIVGKCLLESAIGGADARQVTGRFARSFLAQLIGLSVTYIYFEIDDPDLYMSKVRYILDNDVNDMEMSFSEEIYNSSGNLERIVELIPHGANIVVTNETKHKYLTKFAQYRLSESIKSEMEHFIKGLISIVPDQLLSIFDENELELVMCGLSKISVEDMKAHANTENAYIHQILDWFWTIVSSFTQDELARLLQFTTGCSQLPPDGFKALSPKFKISILEYQRGLPTAHTCFNELCLPNYECYEDFHRMMKIAITEGATGFGLV